MRLDFVSDNVSGMAPEALDAVVRANDGYMASYGMDPLTVRAADLLREALDADVEVHFVASGTAANAVALSALCRPFEAVVAHHQAHIFTDEAAAPSFFGGGLGATALPGASGRIAPDDLSALLEQSESSSSQPPGVLCLSNATELGAVYDEAAIGRLTTIARAHRLPVHLDGARIGNAAAAGFDLRRLKHLGIDVLAAGGAKSGMPATEAIVLFDKALARRFRTRLKQAGQLVSKSRFAAAAWVGMLETGAWIARAGHANAMARRLAARLPLEIVHPVESNAVFARMDPAAHDRLLAAGWQALRYPGGAVRFMCSWATTDQGIDELCAAIDGVL